MAASERPFVATPIAQAGGRVIASPFQFYTTGEDRLRVVSLNSLTGVALKIHSRAVDSAGKIQANADDHIPNTNRTTKTTEHNLGVGALLNLTVFANTGAPSIGQTFVIVQLIRGTGAAAIVLGTLLQGYITSTQHLAWPGSPIQNSLEGQGFIREIVGTDPPAGTNPSETVPAGARWQLLAWTEVLLTDATAINRASFLAVVEGVNAIGVFSSSFFHGASTSIQYTWAAGLTNSGAVLTGASASLPTDLPLLAGWKILITTPNLQAGDNYGAPCYIVREWLEVN